MNYGPLEFADYLRRNGKPVESDTVRAARAAKPVVTPPVNLLRVVSGPTRMRPVTHGAPGGTLNVYEAVAMNPPAPPRAPGVISVAVETTAHPMVLVLSSHQTTEWRLSIAAEADVRALLISGFGQSSVTGAVAVAVHRIGGFYAFRRGSAEYRHLQSEVLRCTGQGIELFQSLQVGTSLVL
jgi:hypothetical protein